MCFDSTRFQDSPLTQHISVTSVGLADDAITSGVLHGYYTRLRHYHHHQLIQHCQRH